MTPSPSTSCTAFFGTTRIASGDLRQVLAKATTVLDPTQWTQLLIFDNATSSPMEVDFRGTAEDVLQRIPELPPGLAAETIPVEEDARRPGRPKLGVVAREVTLLPRHWDWLASQPGGASVALRKLVEHARVANQGRDRQRRAQEAAYRFLSAMAGNESGFEEATRALFAGKPERFDEVVEPWPLDIREHAKSLAAPAFERPEPAL
ncbi:MAG TPA: DUF2239 family protein [Bryobacteraceae bacterium]|nr:DUF2239 family protein [Bryobacteraceae bacterium]